MRSVVTGATGFVGPRLLRLLDRPVVLTRNAQRARPALARFDADVHSWDLMKEPPPATAFDNAEVVFHLAGENVAAGRWTAARKQAIRDSRIVGTRHLVDRLIALPNKPRVLVSASAVGYYGDRGEEILTEDSQPADDFLGEVCVAWEREVQRAAQHGIRVAMLRIGIVLGADGGALAKMLPPFKLGLGGPLGNGKQWMPWIHVDDLAALFIHAAETNLIDGPVNAVAPNAVRNAEFTKLLANEIHRPAFMPAPYFGLRLLFGEFAKVLFASQHVEPGVAKRTGFEFRYPHLQQALNAVLNPDAVDVAKEKVTA